MVKQSKRKRFLYAIFIFIILLAIDQITKQIILKNNVDIVLISNILELKIVQNTGGAFGIANENTQMIIVTNLIVLGLIIRFIYSQKGLINNQTLYTLILILAGGFGNLIDRLIQGFVVDFINLYPSTNFPNFNFADIYIVVGWIALAFNFAMYTYKEMKILKK